MNVSNTWFSDIPVRFGERHYTVVHGRWPDGSAALLLQNVETTVLPVTVTYGSSPREANETLIVNERRLIKALERAGIIKATPKLHTSQGVKMRWCRVIHPELVRRSELNARNVNGRDGGEHELAQDRENSRER